MPPYELNRTDCVGEYPVERHDRLENALRARDRFAAKADPKRYGYRVLDADAQDRGEAEWCVVCGKVGTFAPYECEGCR